MIKTSSGSLVFDVAHPYHGAIEGITDVWVGYQRKIGGDRYRLRVQLNVRNLFGSDDLTKVTVQPDGSAGSYRIPEPRTWALTTTVEY